MSQRRTLSFLAATIVLAVAGFDSAAQPTAPPIRRIDHIMIRADDPAKVYAFFTDVLRLPVAWPLMSPRQGVATGGIGFGNVNVEAIRFPGQKGQPSGAQLLGFAFEPSPLAATLAELDRRSITYGEPRPLIAAGTDGSKSTLWTNVTLRQFSDGEAADATMHVFLSEYSPAYVNVERRRERLRTQLAESGGGPLGVEGVEEVIVGVRDLEAARRLWQKLLDPSPLSGPDRWAVGDGPAIRLVQARENATQALVIKVASLPRAKAFLRENGLLGADSGDEATIDPSRIHGLNIRVVGSTAPPSLGQSAQPPGEADRKQVTGILDSWEKAWNSHDMRALAALFHEDGIWILWTGQVWKGRTAIEEGHAAVHKTVFRNSVQRERLEELTFVGPDAAIVRFYSTLTGDERSPDKVVRSRKILMVTKRDGAWRVGWGQNTRLADTTPD